MERLERTIDVETDSSRLSYRVTSIDVVADGDVEVLEPAGGHRLTLITCYPFSGVLRSGKRFVVIGEAVGKESTGAHFVDAPPGGPLRPGPLQPRSIPLSSSSDAMR